MENTVIDTAPLIGRISEQGALAAFMLLVIMGMAWLLIYLIKRNDALSEKMTAAFIQNTAVISEFKEVIRAKNNQ